MNPLAHFAIGSDCLLLFIAGTLVFLLLPASFSNCSAFGVSDIEAVEDLNQEYTAEKTQMKREELSTFCFKIPVSPGTLTSEKVSNYTNCKTIIIREQGILDVADGALTALVNVEKLEINFNHLETIRRGMWHGLHSLTWLSLHKDNIVNLEPHAFAEIPELTRLTLSGNDISEIRSDIWETDNKLNYLGLHNNTIPNLSPGVFKKLQNLRSLDLSGNLLMAIDSSTFEGLGLYHLYLDRNRLTELRTDMWQGLDRNELAILSIESNLIQHIESQCFGSLPNLVSLFLSHNPLDQITAEIFDKTSLSSLHLISTGLTKLNTGLFLDSLSSLESLNLNENDIELTPDSFQGLKNLRTLHLENCEISEIRARFWNGLESLFDIYLGNNRINSIPSGAFQNLHNVRKLYMESNNIQKLKPHALTGLKSIQGIDLKHNELSTLDQNIFNPDDFPETDGHPSTLQLGLAGNPIQCDGSLSWMIGQKWLDPWELKQATCADHPDMTLHTYLQCYTC